MPPQRGRGRPRRMHVDEEAALAPHAFPLQSDLKVPLEFQVLSVSQVKLFHQCSLKSFELLSSTSMLKHKHKLVVMNLLGG